MIKATLLYTFKCRDRKLGCMIRSQPPALDPEVVFNSLKIMLTKCYTIAHLIKVVSARYKKNAHKLQTLVLDHENCFQQLENYVYKEIYCFAH